MITEEEAMCQVRRLRVLRGYPEEPTEFVAVLIRAEHETHAAQVITAILHEESRCPAPADILRVLRVTARSKIPECPLCGGTGWMYDAEVLVTKSPDRGGKELVERLDHARAKALQGKLDPATQAVYEAGRICSCRKRGAA